MTSPGRLTSRVRIRQSRLVILKIVTISNNTNRSNLIVVISILVTSIVGIRRVAGVNIAVIEQ